MALPNNAKTTEEEYDVFISQCFELFKNKNRDYGFSWQILRLSTLTDQIFIKAKRIRTIQEKGTQKVSDEVTSEFMGIVNYSVMALILHANEGELKDASSAEISALYLEQTNEIKTLLFNKNHDYGEAWRLMRVSSMTDIILMKLLRIKQIEDNQGVTVVSEGVEAGYQDIVNYAVFCLIKLSKP